MTTYTTTEQRALTYYRADLNRIPPLTREEEAMLVERLRLAHDHTLPLDTVTQAKQRLVEGMQRLVMFLALKQAPRFVRQDLEDLTQEASLALLEAVWKGLRSQMREGKADARAWRGARQGRLPGDTIEEE